MNNIASNNTNGSSFIGLWVFLFLFLRPYPIDIIGRIGVRLVDIGIICIVLIYTFILTKRRHHNLSISLLFVCSLLALLTTTLFISTIFSQLQGVSQVGIRDILDSSRYIQYIILIYFGYVLAGNRKFTDLKFAKAIFVLALLTLILGLVQRFLPSMSYIFNIMYTPEHQSSRIFTTQRVTSFFGNPNSSALMMSGFLLYLLSFISRNLSSLSSGTRFKLYVALLFFTFFIMISGSRTGFISFLGTLLIFFVFTTKPIKWIPFFLIFTILILILKMVSSAMLS